MMNPDQSPQATQAYAYHLVVVISTIRAPSPETNLKVSGRVQMSGTTAADIKTVEMMSCHLTVLSTFSSSTLVRWVAKKVVMNEAKIPTAVIKSGK
jgi:hypothetical protein